VSIEVVHTDAEGRMVLADALALAARDKPALMLDYATLTGSCVVALGSRYSGAFSNREGFRGKIVAAGARSGERVWPMPVDADYDEPLESEIADVKQCILESDADHILAFRFLSRFVPDALPWIHLDLAASEHKGGLAHVPTDVTGFGVRFSLNLLLEQGLLP
jgi:leucyl aminopeptidase